MFSITPMTVVFFLAAAMTVGSAVMVVGSGKMLHAALWLVSTLFGVAVLFALLQASFFAVVQVLVYIGAIAILVIFAVMLTRRVMDDSGPQMVNGWWAGAFACTLFFMGLVYMMRQWQPFFGSAPEMESDAEMIRQLGVALVSPDAFAVPFEVASVLLFAAVVGSIYLAWQQKR